MATELTPAIAIHLSAALGALATGPLALWTRQGTQPRPRLHRAFGYAWVTLMLASAVSALFIHGGTRFAIAGFSPIHLLVPTVFATLFFAFRMLARGNIAGHRKAMRGLYYGACVTAGVFTLLPQRYLGQLVFGQWLGLI